MENISHEFPFVDLIAVLIVEFTAYTKAKSW